MALDQLSAGRGLATWACGTRRAGLATSASGYVPRALPLRGRIEAGQGGARPAQCRADSRRGHRATRRARRGSVPIRCRRRRWGRRRIGTPAGRRSASRPGVDPRPPGSRWPVCDHRRSLEREQTPSPAPSPGAYGVRPGSSTAVGNGGSRLGSGEWIPANRQRQTSAGGFQTTQALGGSGAPGRQRSCQGRIKASDGAGPGEHGTPARSATIMPPMRQSF